MRLRLFLIPALLAAGAVTAQVQETHPFNGVRPKEVGAVAYTHATIVVDADTRIEDGTLIVEKGRVRAAGRGIPVPPGTVVHDLSGKWIYPSFIDLHSSYGIPKAEVVPRTSPAPQPETDRKGAFGWNQAIRSDVRAAELFEPDEETAKELRAIGFGAVMTHRMDGIARGSGALVTLGSEAADALLVPDAGAWYSFSKGSSTQSYPSSLMGSVALLRQTYYDARWYAEGGHNSERNLALEAWNDNQRLPQFFDAGDKWNALRADRIGDEFGVQYIICGGGNEYQRVEEIRGTGGAFILPLRFPDAWNAADPYTARMVSTAELLHWEHAPYNAIRLREAGVAVAFTARGLEDRGEFLKALRTLRECGMPEGEVLRALTLTPAGLVKREKEIGALREGYHANFFVSSGDVLDEETVIYDHVIQGRLHEVNPVPPANLAGTWQLDWRGGRGELTVKGDPGKYQASLRMPVRKEKEAEPDDNRADADTLTREVNLEQQGAQLTLVIRPDSAHVRPLLRLSGVTHGNTWNGRMQDVAGEWAEWTASRTAPAEEAEGKKEQTSLREAPGAVLYPFTSFGWKERPKAETVHIVHATLWTNEAEGIVEDGEIILHNGKIAAVGRNLDASRYPGVQVVDAKGRHVTPGIMDEHSHIALSGVNEAGQASSAEVQESSVIDPEDIEIYRQLSGGVTAAQLLHGSANPIGGQSALIKLRWGAGDRDMLIAGADGFIKFALGENVKQSNWGDHNRVRFPQTRMGVEQVYYDHFIRAREYGQEWEKWRASGASAKKSGKVPPPPRRDLELDALLEILQSRRFVTCHSYQQGEINMLMHVADSMGFRINTFTHILEGYKLADKMRAHGAGGSSFSDWWAYKTEVKDAIPHNGALMWENGITVAFNSDDAEMARRLNQEAAKAVKYGNVPEQEALKFVTLNPARLLHLDDRMGSLKAGKDADVVLWSDHPLSIYAKADMTFVDGVRYYDAERDRIMRRELAAERDRIIAKMIAEGPGEKREPAMPDKKYFHCDTLGDR
jgi:imidazolonepropionase-like amidohydrolase